PAARASTGCPTWPTGTTFPSVVTTNSPCALPTQTPSGARARAEGASSSNSLIRAPPASILTTPRSHASQSDGPLAISRRPSTQGNPSVPEASIVVSAERSAATHVSPRRSPTRPAGRRGEPVAGEARVGEDEGPHGVRLRRLGEGGAGIERDHALPRRRQRPVRHGEEGAARQESPAERALHEDAARRVARIEHQVRYAAGHASLLPRPAVGIVARGSE